MTAAAIARIVSTPLAAGAIAAGARAGRGLGGAAARGAEGAAAPGRGGLGACAGAALLKTGAGAAGPPLGPPGGSVGNLIVGAAEGLGGRLMRTVSFLGWTFPVSFFGGTAPPGILGMFSAIKLFQYKLKLLPGGVKLLLVRLFLRSIHGARRSTTAR
ncbi:MAG: hypothetical protein QOJ40_1848 [Verrucomicrobiota bacterium]